VALTADRSGGIAVPVVDTSIRGGRVIDPESDFDGVATVEISGGRIVHVGDAVASARRTIDATGLVVAPGFIDLHSHAQSLAGARLQALDGVTTAVDLECGTLSVPTWYDHAATQGRPINYGYAASWAAARAFVLADTWPDPSRDGTGFGGFQSMSATRSWLGPLDRQRRDRLTHVLGAALAEGALGVGMLLGYQPDVDPDEVLAVADLAATAGTGTFVHSRSSARTGPVTALDAVLELTEVARRTGGHVHLCHVNSTSSCWLDEIVDALGTARADGADITTEAYPYERGSTVIGAAFLSPAELRREAREPSSLIYTPTGETIADATRLEHLRRTDPGGLVLTLTYDTTDADEAALLDRSLLMPDAAFASDAMPTTTPVLPEDAWPLPDGAYAHPRSAGCFSRVLRVLVRERSLLTLPAAIRRCTLVPADILARTAPTMRTKGRLQAGADADVVVFDPTLIGDRATYTDLAPSLGVRHLLVGGHPVVADGVLDPGADTGLPVTTLDERSATANPYPTPAFAGGDT
jgi:N-acyl-D-aspartate/D-glutamate deacylase